MDLVYTIMISYFIIDFIKLKHVHFNFSRILVRLYLDVMNIEKNVCESIINTLLNVNGKSKEWPKSSKGSETYVR